MKNSVYECECVCVWSSLFHSCSFYFVIDLDLDLDSVGNSPSSFTSDEPISTGNYVNFGKSKSGVYISFGLWLQLYVFYLCVFFYAGDGHNELMYDGSMFHHPMHYNTVYYDPMYYIPMYYNWMYGSMYNASMHSDSVGGNLMRGNRMPMDGNSAYNNPMAGNFMYNDPMYNYGHSMFGAGPNPGVGVWGLSPEDAAALNEFDRILANMFRHY